jgi:hypothetical protein
MSQQIYRLSNDKVVLLGTAIKKTTCMHHKSPYSDTLSEYVDHEL